MLYSNMPTRPPLCNFRLGSFLFARIAHAGKDDRFDAIKPYTLRFLNVWSIQASKGRVGGLYEE